MKYKILYTVDDNDFKCWDIASEIEKRIVDYLGCGHGEVCAYGIKDLRSMSTHIILRFHDEEIDFTVSPFEVIDIEEIAKKLIGESK